MSRYKVFLKVLFVAVLVSVSLQGNSQAATDKNTEQAQIKADELAVSVALPELADILLKGGEPRSGRVIGIDPQEQTLSIQRSDKTALIPLKQVEKVVFRNGALAYRSNGRQIIRGERSRPAGKQVTWNDIPLSTFSMKNPTQGQAVISLTTPIVSAARLRGIESVAKDRQYVMDIMQFNLQQRTMTISVTPY